MSQIVDFLGWMPDRLLDPRGNAARELQHYLDGRLAVHDPPARLQVLVWVKARRDLVEEELSFYNVAEKR